MALAAKLARIVWAVLRDDRGWNGSARFALGVGSGRFTSDRYQDLPRLDVGNADSIIIYRSLYSDPAQNETQAAEGDWFVAKTVKVAETGSAIM